MDSSETTVMHAPAKVNLYLHITGVLDNGYHELDTLFFALDEPRDTLTFTPGKPGSGCSIDCALPGLAKEENLAFKAYQAFTQATGFTPDLHIHIDKNIPAGAGLGGGSTDAATVLRYLNTSAGNAALDQNKLIHVAATLGADVPFFLLGTPARAKGIGDKLVPETVDLSKLTLILACPAVHVNTAWAYGAFDDEQTASNGVLTSAVTHNNRAAPATTPVFHNDFETVVFKAFPAIRKVKEILLRHGAAGAAMSGSGASLFALFRDAKEAEKATRSLAAQGVKTYIRFY